MQVARILYSVLCAVANILQNLSLSHHVQMILNYACKPLWMDSLRYFHGLAISLWQSVLHFLVRQIIRQE